MGVGEDGGTVWGGGQWGLGVGRTEILGISYLVANTYGLNFNKIADISIFRGAEAHL